MTVTDFDTVLPCAVWSLRRRQLLNRSHEWQEKDIYMHTYTRTYMYTHGASQVVPVVKNPPASAGTRDLGSIPRSGRSPGIGNGSPLHCVFLENSMDRGAWWATVHGVAKSQTRLSTHMNIHTYVYMFA